MSELGPEVDRTLRLLASGLHDKAIAQEEEVTPRSVRRRLGRYMATVGAKTRFHAGFLYAQGVIAASADPSDVPNRTRPLEEGKQE